MEVESRLTNLTGVTVGECLGDPPANWYRIPQSGSPIAGPGSSNAGYFSGAASLGSSTSSKPSPTLDTSVKPSTSVVVPPITTCAVQAGSFCGKINAFGDKAGCLKSAAHCYLSHTSCLSEAGARNIASCTKFRQICQELSTYCATCGFMCSSTQFTH